MSEEKPKPTLVPLVDTIISGGQVGVDQGALYGAKELHIPTRGWIPKGFLTIEGPAPHLVEEFGLQEHDSSRYPARTEQNVLDSDGTLLIITHDPKSNGCELTRGMCRKHERPIHEVNLTEGIKRFAIFPFQGWLQDLDIKTLNVAGNSGKRDTKAQDIAFRKAKAWIINSILVQAVKGIDY